MNMLRTFSATAMVVSMAFAMGACSNMSRQDKSTATGAAIGGVAGAVLTGGSGVGTVGGAVVGGVIGHEVERRK
jgi:osmotically inducible lipoprotein OsmB